MSVVWSPDGTRLATGCFSGTVRLWDPLTGACLATLEGHGGSVASVSWSPSGALLATGSKDKAIRVWDLGVLATRTSGRLTIPQSMETLFSSSREQCISVGQCDSSVPLMEEKKDREARIAGEGSGMPLGGAFLRNHMGMGWLRLLCAKQLACTSYAGCPECALSPANATLLRQLGASVDGQGPISVGDEADVLRQV